jgi:hypothetical protein
MSATIREQLPELYREWLPDGFDAQAIDEHKATCDQCAMCPGPDEQAVDARAFFRPDVKCCSYQPKLPNYLVGAVLCDERADLDEGRTRIEQLIEGRIGVTPAWLGPSNRYMVLLEASRQSSFGRSLSLRCHFFHPQTHDCTIWRYRQADCATFFCKYDAGADGQRYWRSLDGYLRLVEERLSRWALESVAPDAQQPAARRGQLTLEELEERAPDPASYARWWASWEGREAEFYRACYRAVHSLEPAAARALVSGDDESKRRLTLLHDHHRQVVQPRVPERLRLSADLELFDAGADAHIVKSYSRYEPNVVPKLLFRYLRAFDGKQTVAETQRKLLDEHDVRFGDDLVLQMYRIRILEPCDAPDGDS